MTRPRAAYYLSRRRTRQSAWRCRPARAVDVPPVSVRLVTGRGGLRDRLSPAYSAEQAAVLAFAASVDTLRAVAAVPHRPAATCTLEQAFESGWDGPGLLVAAETPQLTPALLAGAAGLLGEFDAVLGPTADDGFWVFGLWDPADAARLRAVPQAFVGVGSLTVATLRLGLRVAMMPTLGEIRTAADVRAVALSCPDGSRFAAAAAEINTTGRSGTQ